MFHVRVTDPLSAIFHICSYIRLLCIDYHIQTNRQMSTFNYLHELTTHCYWIISNFLINQDSIRIHLSALFLICSYIRLSCIDYHIQTNRQMSTLNYLHELIRCYWIISIFFINQDPEFLCRLYSSFVHTLQTIIYRPTVICFLHRLS